MCIRKMNLDSGKEDGRALHPKALVLQIDDELVGVLAAGARSFQFHATKAWSRPCDGRLFGSVEEAEAVLRRLKQTTHRPPS